jgi:hypothetical protein
MLSYVQVFFWAFRCLILIDYSWILMVQWYITCSRLVRNWLITHFRRLKILEPRYKFSNLDYTSLVVKRDTEIPWSSSNEHFSLTNQPANQWMPKFNSGYCYNRNVYFEAFSPFGIIFIELIIPVFYQINLS